MKRSTLIILCLGMLLLNKNAKSQLIIDSYFDDYIEDGTATKSLSSNFQIQTTAY